MPRAVGFALECLEDQQCQLRGSDGKAVVPTDFFQKVAEYEAAHGGEVDPNAAPPGIALTPNAKSANPIPSVGRLQEFALAQAGLDKELDTLIASEPDAARREAKQNMLTALRQLGSEVKFYRSDKADIPAMGARIAPLWQLEDGKRLYYSTDGGKTKMEVKSLAMTQYTVNAKDGGNSGLSVEEAAIRALEEQGCAFKDAAGKDISLGQLQAAIKAYEQSVASGTATNPPSIRASAKSTLEFHVSSMSRLREFAFAQAGMKDAARKEIASDPDAVVRQKRLRQFDQMHELEGKGYKFYSSETVKGVISAHIGPMWRLEERKPLFAAQGDGPRVEVTSFGKMLYDLNGGEVEGAAQPAVQPQPAGAAQPEAFIAGAQPRPQAAPPAKEEE
jgi:hypothetical protein